VHVFYGSVGLKTHAKVILVVRQEDAQIRRYVHLSTGNYNVTTSRLYTDLGSSPADQILGEDVVRGLQRSLPASRRWRTT
jgi:polyphosphate kinase